MLNDFKRSQNRAPIRSFYQWPTHALWLLSLRVFKRKAIASKNWLNTEQWIFAWIINWYFLNFTSIYFFIQGNVHKGRPTILGHFGHTYLPISYVFCTMPIVLVRFLLGYLLTPKSDVLYGRSPMCKFATW